MVRDGKNLKGRVLGVVLGTIGKRVLKKAFENSVKAIEARNGPRSTPTIDRSAMLSEETRKLDAEFPTGDERLGDSKLHRGTELEIGRA